MRDGMRKLPNYEGERPQIDDAARAPSSMLHAFHDVIPRAGRGHLELDRGPTELKCDFFFFLCVS